MSEFPVKKKSIQRVDSLDYLRGLAAFGIMIYHMYLFNYGEADSSSFLAKIKIYGVSIFYILSGLTLYLVNENRLKLDKDGLTSFYIKRFFRIVPLLWLASLLTLLIHYNPDEFSYNKLIVNITVLPGVVRPASFFANGAWSIGNEIFFYMIFPLFMYLASINKKYLYLVVVITFVALAYFAFNVLDSNIPLGLQWSSYVNPLGQVFFFAMGMGLAALDGGRLKMRKLFALTSIVLLALIFFLPAHGEPIKLVTGYNRLIISALVTLLCFSFYKTDFEFLPAFVRKSLQVLGEISYSLYLIHPLVFYSLVWATKNSTGLSSPTVLIPVTIGTSIFFSYLNYNYFEKYFMNKGKAVLEKMRSRKQYSSISVETKKMK